jgi:hypothetical protein
MSKARSSQIKIRATEFPSFLYADASKFDQNRPHRGLLKGPILVRVSFSDTLILITIQLIFRFFGVFSLAQARPCRRMLETPQNHRRRSIILHQLNHLVSYMLPFLYVFSYGSCSHLNHDRPDRLFHQLHGVQRIFTSITRCLANKFSVCSRMATTHG